MTRIGIFTFVIAAIATLTTARAEAQQVCGYGGDCVVLLAPPSAPPATATPATTVQLYVSPSQAGALEPATVTRPRWGLVIGGAVMLGASWALNIGGSALWMLMPTQHESSYFFWSLVPVVGPWAQLTALDGNDWQRPILALAGVAQGAGLLMAILGTAIRQTVPARGARVADTDPIVVPYASGTGAGLAVAGAF